VGVFRTHVDAPRVLIANSNLVLWGDPGSNKILARIADKLPVKWEGSTLIVGTQKYPAETHAPILIYPNPLNPNKYVVLNSGFTFREYDYLNNVEYQVGVQQLIMVRGGKLYLIHLETQLAHFATYKKDLEQLYSSFKPARLDAAGNPILEDLKPQKIVNPEALPEIEKGLSGGY
jgi:hypothetical protein